MSNELQIFSNLKQQFDRTNTAKRVSGRYERRDDGSLVGGYGSDISVLILRGLQGFYFVIASQGIAQTRNTSQFHFSEQSCIEAAEIYLQQRGLIPGSNEPVATPGGPAEEKTEPVPMPLGWRKGEGAQLIKAFRHSVAAVVTRDVKGYCYFVVQGNLIKERSSKQYETEAEAATAAEGHAHELVSSLAAQREHEATPGG